MAGVDVVFHLAALIGIPYSYKAVHSYVRTNVEGTLNILQAARTGETSRVIHTSTSEVYGSAQQIPIPESHPLQAQSPYSATKIAADKLVESFVRSYGLSASVVRPFNTYGPRQSARAVVPTVISQFLAGIRPIRLGNLSPTRDLSYVDDTVRGFVAVAESDETIGHEVNLGTGNDVSIRELVQIVGALLGVDADVLKEEARSRRESSEVDRLCADTSQAKRLAGWESRVDLKDGLLKTIEWAHSHPDSFRPEVYAI